MKKLKKIWNAFCRGFWQAWLEIPPQSAKSVGELTVTLGCDSTQFDRGVEEAILRLQKLSREARALRF